MSLDALSDGVMAVIAAGVASVTAAFKWLGSKGVEQVLEGQDRLHRRVDDIEQSYAKKEDMVRMEERIERGFDRISARMDEVIHKCSSR